MVKIKRGDCEIYLDGNLQKNLDFVNKRTEHDWDQVALCIGEEGDGKTTLIKICCLYQDPNFNIDNCVFNIEQFNDRVDNSPVGSAILFDESDELDARNLQRTILQIKRKLKRCRKRNLKIWFVTPSFFDLQKYFIMHRVYFMIRVYAMGLKRGFFMFYTRKKLRELYIKGKKEWTIKCVKGNFTGRFTKEPKNFPIDSELYENKKDKATIAISDETSRDNLSHMRQLQTLRYYKDIWDNYKDVPTQKRASQVIGVSQTQISAYRRGQSDTDSSSEGNTNNLSEESVSK